jgi:hypothetical protein
MSTAGSGSVSLRAIGHKRCALSDQSLDFFGRTAIDALARAPEIVNSHRADHGKAGESQ